MLLQTSVCKLLFENLFFILSGVYLNVEELGHMVVLYELPRWLTGKESACSAGDGV